MRTKKMTSWALIIALLWTQILSPEVAQGANITFPVLSGERPWADAWFPTSKAGVISEKKMVANARGTLVHIQDAHAVFEAQRNIEKLLQELKGVSGLKQVFIEGGSGILDPQLRHFVGEGIFLSEEEREIWMRAGQLTGAEAYLMGNQSIRGIGIENKSEYWTNVDQYRRVDARRDEADAFLRAWYQAWQSKAELSLSPDLKKYLEIYVRAQQDAAHISDWLSALDSYINDKQYKNLDEAEAQIEFPNLTRYRYLKKIDQTPDFKIIDKQKEEFFALVRENTKTKKLGDVLKSVEDLIQRAQDGEIDFRGARQIFEELAGYLSDNFSIQRWPELKKQIERMVLASEINPEILKNEAEVLHAQVIKKETSSEAAARLVSLLKVYLLSEKLLSLELSRRDLEEAAAYQLSPETLVTSLAGFFESAGQSAPEDIHSIQKIYDDALAFYRNAVEREDAMKAAIQSNLAFDGSVMVVISGGFHARAFEDFARENHYNYLSLMPRISKVTSEDFAHYRRALLGEGSARSEMGKASNVSAALVTSSEIMADPAAQPRRETVFDLPGARPALDAMQSHEDRRREANSPDMRRSATRPRVTEKGVDENELLRLKSISRSEHRIRTVSTQDLSAGQELDLLLDVRERLGKEQERLGSGGLPEIVKISDIHGAIDKFDALIIDAIRRVLPFSKMPSLFEFKIDHNQPLFDQLKAFGITPEDLRGRLYFENLGDDMDRGPDGVAVWKRSRELASVGLLDKITGNHNWMVFINLAGLHLPFYKGYNFYGYSDQYDSELGSIQDLVEQFHVRDQKKAKNKTWWASRLAQFMQHQKKRQSSVWSKFDDEVNGPKDENGKRDAGRALYVSALASLPGDSSAKKAWDKLRGWYLVDVYTGVRDVGGMSLVWWQNLLRDFEKEYRDIQKSEGWLPDSPADKAWRRAIQMMRDEIIPEYERDLREQLNKPGAGAKDSNQWWWRVFEALNSQNYTSVEWYAKDWIFHKGWGTSVLDELNRGRGDLPEITAANYFDNPILQEIAEIEKEGFALFLRSIYQQTSLHAFLPVNSQGQFYFTYKGTEYRGKGKEGDGGYPSIWEGLKRITDDVRNPEHDFLDMYEALTLVMSWYADNTTKTKPGEILRVLNHFGPEKIAEENGINSLTTGHIPFQQFAKISKDKRGVVSSYNVGGRFFFSDHDMSPAYRYRGLGIWNGPISGILPRGFEHDGNRLIDIRNEPRMIDRDEEGTETVHFYHQAIPREIFIASTIEDIDRRIQELKEVLSRSESRSEMRSVLDAWPSAAKSAWLGNDDSAWGDHYETPRNPEEVIDLYARAAFYYGQAGTLFRRGLKDKLSNQEIAQLILPKLERAYHYFNQRRYDPDAGRLLKVLDLLKLDQSQPSHELLEFVHYFREKHQSRRSESRAEALNERLPEGFMHRDFWIDEVRALETTKQPILIERNAAEFPAGDTNIKSSPGYSATVFLNQSEAGHDAILAQIGEIQSQIAKLFPGQTLLVPQDGLHVTIKGIQHGVGGLSLPLILAYAEKLNMHRKVEGAARGNLVGPLWHRSLGVVMVYVAEGEDVLSAVKSEVEEALNLPDEARPFHMTLAYLPQSELAPEQVRQIQEKINSIPLRTIPVEFQNAEINGYENIAFTEVLRDASAKVSLQRSEARFEHSALKYGTKLEGAAASQTNDLITEVYEFRGRYYLMVQSVHPERSVRGYITLNAEKISPSQQPANFYILRDRFPAFAAKQVKQNSPSENDPIYIRNQQELKNLAVILDPGQMHFFEITQTNSKRISAYHQILGHEASEFSALGAFDGVQMRDADPRVLRIGDQGQLLQMKYSKEDAGATVIDQETGLRFYAGRQITPELVNSLSLQGEWQFYNPRGGKLRLTVKRGDHSEKLEINERGAVLIKNLAPDVQVEWEDVSGIEFIIAADRDPKWFKPITDSAFDSIRESVITERNGIRSTAWMESAGIVGIALSRKQDFKWSQLHGRKATQWAVSAQTEVFTGGEKAFPTQGGSLIQEVSPAESVTTLLEYGNIYPGEQIHSHRSNIQGAKAMELYYVSDGAVGFYIEVNGRRSFLKAQAGDVLVVDPHVIHGIMYVNLPYAHAAIQAPSVWAMALLGNEFKQFLGTTTDWLNKHPDEAAQMRYLMQSAPSGNYAIGNDFGTERGGTGLVRQQRAFDELKNLFEMYFTHKVNLIAPPAPLRDFFELLASKPQQEIEDAYGTARIQSLMLLILLFAPEAFEQAARWDSEFAARLTRFKNSNRSSLFENGILEINATQNPYSKVLTLIHEDQRLVIPFYFGLFAHPGQAEHVIRNKIWTGKTKLRLNLDPKEKYKITDSFGIVKGGGAAVYSESLSGKAIEDGINFGIPLLQGEDTQAEEPTLHPYAFFQILGIEALPSRSEMRAEEKKAVTDALEVWANEIDGISFLKAATEKDAFPGAFKQLPRLRAHLNKSERGEQFNPEIPVLPEFKNFQDEQNFWMGWARRLRAQGSILPQEIEAFWIASRSYEDELAAWAELVSWYHPEALDLWKQALADWTSALDKLYSALSQIQNLKIKQQEAFRLVVLSALYRANPQKMDSETLELILESVKDQDLSRHPFAATAQKKLREHRFENEQDFLEGASLLDEYKNALYYEMIFNPAARYELNSKAEDLLELWNEKYADQWAPLWVVEKAQMARAFQEAHDFILNRLSQAGFRKPSARSESRLTFKEAVWFLQNPWEMSAEQSEKLFEQVNYLRKRTAALSWGIFSVASVFFFMSLAAPISVTLYLGVAAIGAGALTLRLLIKKYAASPQAPFVTSFPFNFSQNPIYFFYFVGLSLILLTTPTIASVIAYVAALGGISSDIIFERAKLWYFRAAANAENGGEHYGERFRERFREYVTKTPIFIPFTKPGERIVGTVFNQIVFGSKNPEPSKRSESRLIPAENDPAKYASDPDVQARYQAYRELAILNESIKPFYEYPASAIVEAHATGDALTEFLEKLGLLSPEAHALLFNAMAEYYRTDPKQPIKSVRKKLEEAVLGYKKKIKKGGINNLENRKWVKGFAMLVSTGVFQIKLNLTYGDLSAYAESFVGGQINPLFERARAGLRARVFGLGSLTSFRTEIGVLSRHQQPDIYSPSEHFAYRALGFEPVYSGPNDVLSLVVGLGLDAFEIVENEGIPVIRFSFKDEINDLGGDKQDSMTAFVLLDQPDDNLFISIDEKRQAAYEDYLRSFASDLGPLKKLTFGATDDPRDKAAKTTGLIQYLQANPGKLLPNADYMLKDELSRTRFLDQLSETPAAKEFLSQKLDASAGFLERTIADLESSRATEAEELPAKIETQLEHLARVAAGQVQEAEREEIELFESTQGPELRLLLDIAETFDLASDFLENLSNHATAGRKATAFIGRLMSAYPVLRDQILARVFNLKWDSRNPKPLSRETLAAKMKVFSRYLKTRFHDANPIVKAARAAFFQTRVHILEQLYTGAANTAIFDNSEFESEFRKVLRRGWRRYLVALNQTDLVIPSAGFLVGAEGHAFHLYPLYHLLQNGMKPALHGESLALKIQSTVPVSSEVVEQSREYGTPPVTAVSFSGTIKNHLGFESHELHFFVLREPLPEGEEITFEKFQSLFESDPAALQPILLSENASADEAYAWQERLVELARAGRLLAIHDWYPDAGKIETLLDFIHLDGADSRHARAQIEILLKNLETDPEETSLTAPDYRQAYLEHQKNKPKKDLRERLFLFSPDLEILEDRLSRLLEVTSVQFAVPALDLFFMTVVAARAEGPLMPEDQFLIFIEEWAALQQNESVSDWASWLQERFAQQESNPFAEQEIRIQGADYLFGKISGIIPSQYRSWVAAFFPKTGEKMVGDAVNWSQPERAKKFVQTWALASRSDRPIVIQGMQPDLDWLQSGLYRHGFSSAQASAQWELYADLILAPVLSRLRAELNSAREEYEILGSEMTADERVLLETKIELIENAIAELGLSESEIEKILAKEGRLPFEDDSVEPNRAQTANERARTQLENLKIARESRKLIVQIEQTEFDQVDSGKFSAQKKALARGFTLLPPAHPATVIAVAALAEKIDDYLNARLSLPYIRDRAYDFLIQELGSDESWVGPERVAAWKKRIQEHRIERDTQRERKIVEPRIAAMQAHLEGIVVSAETPAAIQVWAEELIEMIERNSVTLNGTADSLIASAKSVWAKKLIEWLRFKTKEMREAPIEGVGLEGWDKDEAQIKAARTKLLELSVSVIPEELTESGAGLSHKRNALTARIEGFKIKLKERIKALDEVNFETVTQEAFVEQVQDIKTSIENHVVWLGTDSSQSFQANLRTKQSQVAPFVALAEQIRSTGETKYATTADIGKAFQPLRQRLDKLQKSNRPLFLKLNDLITAKKQGAERILEERIRLREEQKKVAAAEKEKPPVPETITETEIVPSEAVSEAAPLQEHLRPELETIQEPSISVTVSLPQQIDLSEDWPEAQVEENEQTEDALGYIGLVASASMAIEKQLDVEKPWQFINAVSSWIDLILESTATVDAELRQQYYAYLRYAIFSARTRVKDPLVRELSDFLYEKLIYLWHQREKDLSLSRENLELDWRAFYQPVIAARVENELINYRPENEKKLRLLVNFFEPLKAGKERQAYMSRIDNRPKELWLEKIGDLDLLLSELKKRLNPQEDLNEIAFPALAAFHALRDQAEIYLEATVEQDSARLRRITGIEEQAERIRSAAISRHGSLRRVLQAFKGEQILNSIIDQVQARSEMRDEDMVQLREQTFGKEIQVWIVNHQKRVAELRSENAFKDKRYSAHVLEQDLNLLYENEDFQGLLRASKGKTRIDIADILKIAVKNKLYLGTSFVGFIDALNQRLENDSYPRVLRAFTGWPNVINARSLLNAPSIQAYLASKEFSAISKEQKLFHLYEKLKEIGAEWFSIESLGVLHELLPERLTPELTRDDFKYLKISHELAVQINDVISDPRIRDFLRSRSFLEAESVDEKARLLMSKAKELGLPLNTESTGQFRYGLSSDFFFMNPGAAQIISAFYGQFSETDLIALATVTQGEQGSGSISITHMGRKINLTVRKGVVLDKNLVGKKMVVAIKNDANSGQVIALYPAEEYFSHSEDPAGHSKPSALAHYRYFPQWDGDARVRTRNQDHLKEKGLTAQADPIQLAVWDIGRYWFGKKGFLGRGLVPVEEHYVELPVVKVVNKIKGKEYTRYKATLNGIETLSPISKIAFEVPVEEGDDPPQKVRVQLAEQKDFLGRGFGVYISVTDSSTGKELANYYRFPDEEKASKVDFPKLALLYYGKGRKVNGKEIVPLPYQFPGVIIRSGAFVVTARKEVWKIFGLKSLAEKVPFFNPVYHLPHEDYIEVHDAEDFKKHSNRIPEYVLARGSKDGEQTLLPIFDRSEWVESVRSETSLNRYFENKINTYPQHEMLFFLMAARALTQEENPVIQQAILSKLESLKSRPANGHINILEIIADLLESSELNSLNRAKTLAATFRAKITFDDKGFEAAQNQAGVTKQDLQEVVKAHVSWETADVRFLAIRDVWFSLSPRERGLIQAAFDLIPGDGRSHAQILREAAYLFPIMKSRRNGYQVLAKQIGLTESQQIRLLPSLVSQRFTKEEQDLFRRTFGLGQYRLVEEIDTSFDSSLKPLLDRLAGFFQIKDSSRKENGEDNRRKIYIKTASKEWGDRLSDLTTQRFRLDGLEVVSLGDDFFVIYFNDSPFGDGVFLLELMRDLGIKKMPKGVFDSQSGEVIDDIDMLELEDRMGLSFSESSGTKPELVRFDVETDVPSLLRSEARNGAEPNPSSPDVIKGHEEAVFLTQGFNNIIMETGLSRSELFVARVFAAGFISLDAVKRVLGLAPETRQGLWASLTPPEKREKEALFARSILFGKQVVQPDDAFVIGTDLALDHGFLAAVKKVFPGTAFAVIAEGDEARRIEDWIGEQGLADMVTVAETAAQAQVLLREKNPRAVIRGLALTASDEAEKLIQSLPDLEVVVFTSGQLDRMLGFAGVVEEAGRLAQMARAFAAAA